VLRLAWIGFRRIRCRSYGLLLGTCFGDRGMRSAVSHVVLTTTYLYVGPRSVIDGCGDCEKKLKSTQLVFSTDRPRSVNHILIQYAPFAALFIALVASVIDAKTGNIPNYLTLPSLLGAIVIYGTIGGAVALASSLLGALVCLLVPWVFYRVSKGTAIGGGDVKLFAALGACVGPTLGLEMEFASFVLLGVIAITQLTFKGRLLQLLVSMGWILVNPFVPRRYRRQLGPESLTEMRMGPAIFLGTLLVVVLEYTGVQKWFA
jgi:prepilin peptidase CpaA